MNRTLIPILLSGLLLAACAPDTPTPAPAETDPPTEIVTDEAKEAPDDDVTPGEIIDVEPERPPQEGPLPDLAFGTIRIEMEDYTPGTCVEAIGSLLTYVCIQNRGEGDSGPFVVEGGLSGWSVSGLYAGEELCRTTLGSPPQLVIDPDQEIEESDETNNTVILPRPTPPAICTPVSDTNNGGSDSAAATEEPTESADEVVDALCAANGGLQWTGTVCVCPGVVDVVTICGDSLQIDSVTDQACEIDIACDGTGSSGNGGDQPNPCEPWPVCSGNGGED